MVASVASMIQQFNINNIHMLKQLGYEVDVAANFELGNTCDAEQIQKLKEELERQQVAWHQIDFARNVFQVGKNKKAYRQLMILLRENQYLFLHCHSPIGGVLGRIAGHKYKTPVVYTAHGFHFFKSAPVRNWLLFYPVEWLLGWWTDTLITINEEDYERGKRHIHAKHVEYVPGIGIDLKRFCQIGSETAKQELRNERRKDCGVGNEQVMLLSVGELSSRKNHMVVLEAIAGLNANERENLCLFICGQGPLQNELEQYIVRNNLEKQVKLMGFCADVAKLYQIADIFVFPSLQEGLPVALMEAMATELPCIASRIRGNIDLLVDGKGGYLVNPLAVEEYRSAIEKMVQMKRCEPESLKRMGQMNLWKIQGFSHEVVDEKMREIYRNVQYNNTNV